MDIDYGTGPINWDKVRSHYGHRVEIAFYGPVADPVNIALECMRCGEVLTDSDQVEEAD